LQYQNLCQLKSRGLVTALIDSIVDEKLARAHGSRSGFGSPGTGGGTALHDLQNERAKIEKQLLGN
jgi:hypothetical protein